MIGIYKITNPNNKIYIGKSKNIEKRWCFYKTYNKHIRDQSKLYNSFQKYGVENHTFEIIEECTVEQLNEREIYWIQKLKCIEEGLNLTKGGDGGEKCEESKLLISFKKSKPILQYDLQGNFVREWKSVIYAIKSTKISSISNCLKLKIKTAGGYIWKYKKDNLDFSYNFSVNANKGKKKPEGFGKKPKGFGKWNKGKKHSMETKNKMHKPKPTSGKPKCINQYDLEENFMKEWPSAVAVKKALNISCSSINNNLKNLSKQAGGFKWKYK